MNKRKISYMDLEQLALSGQCFRMKKIEDNIYSVIAKGKYLEISQEGEVFTYSCKEEEFSEVWCDYFDLKTDYAAIQALVDPKDIYLQSAMKYGYGIRVLKQDLWEMIITFIISQNNNMTRIRNSVDALCKTFGEHRQEPSDYYLFPQPEQILKNGLEGLAGLGLGYRDKYVISMAEKCSSPEGKLWLEELKDADYNTAHNLLIHEFGIGKKVADCICLFGLHHVDAFPVDTHVKQILSGYYPAGFPLERYKGWAGILQQYMFYYKVNAVVK